MLVFADEIEIVSDDAVIVRNNVANHQGGSSNYIQLYSDTSAVVESNTAGAVAQPYWN
jgi:hypothetical protein